MLEELGGVVTRVGDEAVGEMWSLYDGQDVVAEIDPKFAANIETHIRCVLALDPFHVSANTYPRGDRSKPPRLALACREGDRCRFDRARREYQRAAAYANQAFTKPAIAN